MWSGMTRSPFQRFSVNFDGLLKGHFHGASCHSIVVRMWSGNSGRERIQLLLMDKPQLLSNAGAFPK
jgi:hypothetical protein